MIGRYKHGFIALLLLIIIYTICVLSITWYLHVMDYETTPLKNMVIISTLALGPTTVIWLSIIILIDPYLEKIVKGRRDG